MVKYDFVKETGRDVDNIDRILANVKSRCKYLVAGSYTLTVKKRTTPRTLRQNALYRLWLNMISTETGNSVSLLHEFFKNEFLTPTEHEVFGKVIEIEPSTKTLNTKEFSVFLDNVQAFAACEIGMQLPTPEDAAAMDMLNDYINE